VGSDHPSPFPTPVWAINWWPQAKPPQAIGVLGVKPASNRQGYECLGAKPTAVEEN